MLIILFAKDNEDASKFFYLILYFYLYFLLLEIYVMKNEILFDIYNYQSTKCL